MEHRCYEMGKSMQGTLDASILGCLMSGQIVMGVFKAELPVWNAIVMRWVNLCKALWMPRY